MSDQLSRQDSKSNMFHNSHPTTKMADIVKKTSDKVLKKIHRKYQKSHRYLKLPAELRDLIIEHAIPKFRFDVDPAYKHKCGQPLDKKPLRCRVSGIPKMALDLQLVSRGVRLQAKEHMFKAYDGRGDYHSIFECGCVSDFQAVSKYTKPLYLLHQNIPGWRICSPYR